MHPVLMVAYYYPPAGGAGVQRTLKFSRYLPEFGWRPHLLVPRDADYPVEDHSLIDEIPSDAVVHRTRIVEPYGLYRRVTGRRGKHARSLDVATLSRDAHEDRKLSERFSEWMRSTFFIPDARIGWFPFAVRAGLRVVNAERPSVIYSSAPPYTCHLIGLRLHRRTGLPWVADFRDSWVDWLSAARRSGLARKIDLSMEGAVLRTASALVSVSRGVADDLVSRHPESADRSWHFIPNGFDPPDIEDAAPDRAGVADTELLVTYTGTLYGPRHPRTLVDALESLDAEGHPCVGSMRFRFVGRTADSIRDDVARRRVASRFEFAGYVDHARAVALSKASDAMLLVIDDTPQSAGILTGKIFEYIGLRKPVLAIAPAGEARDILEDELRCGWVASPGDVGMMKEKLIAMWTAWKDGTLEGPESSALGRFTRREQTAALAAVFEECVGKAER